MDTWLWENRQQYQMFVGLTQLLLDRDFSPLPTEPYVDNTFRTDHTEAMMNLVRSFPGEEMSWPLRIFSTGPLFRPGRTWTDAVDVEWVGTVGEAEQRDMIQLVSDMAGWLTEAGIVADDLTMVYGHLGWTGRLATSLGLSSAAIHTFVNELRQGRLTVVPQALGELSTEAAALFCPRNAHDFFQRLSQFIEVLPIDGESVHWTTKWDLSLTGKRTYYTGLVFSLCHRRSGQPLINGGQFEMASRGESLGGLGFTLYLDACRVALRGQNSAAV
jgi:histidyl-tRNA synthetase